MKTYFLKILNFTEKFPEWELIKIGSSRKPLNRIYGLLEGLNLTEKDFEFEIMDDTDEWDIRYNEYLVKPVISISPFDRIIGEGRSYKPDDAIKTIDEKMYEELKKITDIKTKLKINWGITEWAIVSKQKNKNYAVKNNIQIHKGW